MSTTIESTGTRKRSRRKAAVVASAVVLGLGASAAVTSSANAAFTLNSGTLHLTSGSTTGTPPSSGSWVTLPEDPPSTGYFNNTTSTAASGQYTLINGSATTGLTLGAAQPTGGIFGTLTTFNGAPFYALTVSGSTPTLSFTGSASSTGTRTLTAGDLTGLRISYGGGTYDVSTSQATGGKHTAPLTGTITGDATTPGGATIKLDWQSDLTEPGFSPYQAKFHWEGPYTP